MFVNVIAYVRWGDSSFLNFLFYQSFLCSTRNFVRKLANCDLWQEEIDPRGKIRRRGENFSTVPFRFIVPARG